MAVELENLYADLDEKYEVTLRTSSCFQRDDRVGYIWWRIRILLRFCMEMSWYLIPD